MAPSLSTFLLVCSITQLYGFTVWNIEIHDDSMNLIKFQKFRTANTQILETLWISLDFKFFAPQTFKFKFPTIREL